jgi:hypothetical protein
MPRECRPVEFHLPAPEAVRRLEVLHRLPIRGEIVEQLAAGKMELHSVFIRE